MDVDLSAQDLEFPAGSWDFLASNAHDPKKPITPNGVSIGLT